MLIDFAADKTKPRAKVPYVPFRLPENPNRALLRIDERRVDASHEQLQKRRLSRAVWPKQRGMLPQSDRYGKLIENGRASANYTDVGDFKDRRRFGGFGRRARRMGGSSVAISHDAAGVGGGAKAIGGVAVGKPRSILTDFGSSQRGGKQ